MEGKQIKNILGLILGDKQYNELLNNVKNENNNSTLNSCDIDIIMESYIIAILVIGFSKKQVDIDKYKIHLKDNTDLKIDTKSFCKKYEKYISYVENFKLDLLRQLL